MLVQGQSHWTVWMAVGPNSAMLNPEKVWGKSTSGRAKKKRWSSGGILSFGGHQGESECYLEEPIYKHNTYTHLSILVEDIKVWQDQTKQKCVHEALKKASTV